MAHIGIGASGYAGAELLRLCAAIPTSMLSWRPGDTQAGAAIADVYPSLAAVYPGLSFTSYEPTAFEGP